MARVKELKKSKVFYEKRGRRYVPVAEKYVLQGYTDHFKEGAHLIMSYPGGTSCMYNIDPAYAPMIAAGRIAREPIVDVLRRASDMRPSKSLITSEQRDAWEKLSESFGDDIHLLSWPSAHDAVEAAIAAMAEEANKLLTNPSVKKAYEHFLLVCELTKEENEPQS